MVAANFFAKSASQYRNFRSQRHQKKFPFLEDPTKQQVRKTAESEVLECVYFLYSVYNRKSAVTICNYEQ
jgi:hypothetical protein